MRPREPGLLAKIFDLKNVFKVSLFVLLFLAGTFFRYRLLDEAGGDLTIFRMAVVDFIEGKNPYKYTVDSYAKDSSQDHGYAYFPTLIYVYAPLYKLHLSANIPLQRVWKSAIFLAEIGVAYLLVKMFYKKDYLTSVLVFCTWWFNPFLMGRNSYVYTDPFGILFMLLALHFLEEDDIKAGVFYAISFSFKSFPAVLFPLFLIKSKNKLKFLVSGAFFALLISIPFLKSIPDFTDYIRGSLLVHGSREPQGRPFIAMMSYITSWPIFTLSTSQIYKYAAIFLSMLSTLYLLLREKVKDKYVLSTISFAIFYLFTPVLTRTYMLWFIPVYSIGMYKVFERGSLIISRNKKLFYYLSILLFYVFYFWYLSIWFRGIRMLDSGVAL